MSETINLATFKEVYLLIDENPDVDIRVSDKIDSCLLYTSDAADE